MTATDTLLPTLSPDGWMNNPQALLEKVFAYYVTSDRMQSTMFKEFVYTMQDALMQHSNPEDIKNQVAGDLQTILGYYFYGTVDITITAREPNIDTDPKLMSIVKYDIEITVDQDDEVFKLSRVLETTGSRILNYQDLIYRLNNFGEGGK